MHMLCCYYGTWPETRNPLNVVQQNKHLPIEALNTLLEALNNIWVSGKFPDSKLLQ